MTEQQAAHIQSLRNVGLGYLKIANALSLSINTVKTYCRRHDLHSVMSGQNPAITIPMFCRNCGQTIVQTPGRKRRKFCCNPCRVKWWNSHLDRVKRRANYPFTCAYCGVLFTSYGNRHRKYCSHNHYILHRYVPKGSQYVDRNAI
jgi:hypothetical protein